MAFSTGLVFLLFLRIAVVAALLCVCENGLNFPFKKLCKKCMFIVLCQTIQRCVRKIRVPSSISNPSSRDNHSLKQQVFTKYLLLGFGDLAVNKMDMLSSLGDLGGWLSLCFKGCINVYIDCFVPSPSPLPKRREGIKPHVFVT